MKLSFFILILCCLIWSCNIKESERTTANPTPVLLLQSENIEQLRKHAETTEGKRIVQQLKSKLTMNPDPFALSSNAVGYATLFLLSSDKTYSDSALQFVLGTLRDSIKYRSQHQESHYTGLWNSDYKAIYRAEILMDIAITYDICKNCWPESANRIVAQELFNKAKLLWPNAGFKWDSVKSKKVPVQGLGYNNTAWSNWQGIVNGGVGTALLALREHPVYGDSSKVFLETTVAKFKEHFSYFGDYMWTAEGFNYLRYELCAGAAPFILSYRNVVNPDFLKNSQLDNIIPLFVTQSVIIGDSIYTPIYGQLQTNMEMSRWRSGIWLLIIGLSHENHKVAAKWIFDQTYGMDGTQDFNIFHAKDALYALLYYPFSLKAKHPADLYPLSLYDEKQGYCIFRNKWGKDEIVATILDNHQAKRASHSHQDAGSIRLLGLGEDWIYKGRKNLRVDTKEKRHGTHLESVVLVSGANNWRGGKITSYKANENGSGKVAIDLTDTYYKSNWFKKFQPVGVTHAKRKFQIAFPLPDKAVIHIMDSISGGGEKIWQIATPQEHVDISENSFTIYNQDKTKHLKVEFSGKQKPLKIEKEFDMIRAYFGTGNLYCHVIMTLEKISP